MIDEIAMQSTQLDVHSSVIEIERQKRMQEEHDRETIEKRNQQEISKNAHDDQQRILDQELEADDQMRRSLIEDVIKEANDTGVPIPPAAVRLMNHFKCK